MQLEKVKAVMIDAYQPRSGIFAEEFHQTHHFRQTEKLTKKGNQLPERKKFT